MERKKGEKKKAGVFCKCLKCMFCCIFPEDRGTVFPIVIPQRPKRPSEYEENQKLEKSNLSNEFLSEYQKEHVFSICFPLEVGKKIEYKSLLCKYTIRDVFIKSNQLSGIEGKQFADIQKAGSIEYKNKRLKEPNFSNCFDTAIDSEVVKVISKRLKRLILQPSLVPERTIVVDAFSSSPFTLFVEHSLVVLKIFSWRKNSMM